MSAPKSLHDLSGKWSMNRDLSTDVSPVLEIQGFNALIRKAVTYAPVNLTITQKGDGEIHIDQTTTASMPAVKEEWYPKDHEWRETKDSFLGKVRSRSRWTKAVELEKGFLTEGLGGEDEVIESEVEALEGTEWRAVQVWMFEEEKFVRRVVTTGKGGEKAETRLVYDFKVHLKTLPS
ncbi:hypothetical protein B0A55_07241 [Friedmanniomyces simplex]|uniref:Lipocalin-like domain-containing protein n=1 Tax=Friedmanniomyces simplex TaxID=329884 RepID=A0A4V5NI83_9PEZI|nr:hypothetical protein B0A55_07241 [Friedmanniomyces simplex]